MPEETVYGPILLDINLWESTVRAKVEDYHEIGQLISQRYRVDCEYSFFASVIANTDIPGTKWVFNTFSPFEHDWCPRWS